MSAVVTGCNSQHHQNSRYGGTTAVHFSEPCYLVSIQPLPWLHDANTLVNSTEATEGTGPGREMQGVLLPWDSVGGRELHRHLADTDTITPGMIQSAWKYWTPFIKGQQCL